MFDSSYMPLSDSLQQASRTQSVDEIDRQLLCLTVFAHILLSMAQILKCTGTFIIITDKYLQRSMINFTQLIACHDSELYKKEPQGKKYLSQDTLRLLIDSQTNFLLMIGNLCYGVLPNSKIGYYLFQNNSGFFIILELEETQKESSFQIIVKENIELLLLCLKEKCQVINRGEELKGELKESLGTPGAPTDQKFKQQGEKIISEKKQDIKPENKEESSLLTLSKSLGKGIFLAAKLVSKGITTVGGMISNSIESSEEVKLSEGTKKSLQNINQVSGQIYKFSSQTARKLISYGQNAVIEEIKKNKSATEIYEENKTFNDVKGGVLTAIKVVINVYDGVIEGGDEIKNCTFKTSQEIVGKKYGKDAEHAFKNVAEGVNNAYKIYKLPKDEAKRIFDVKGITKEDKSAK